MDKIIIDIKINMSFSSTLYNYKYVNNHYILPRLYRPCFLMGDEVFFFIFRQTMHFKTFECTLDMYMYITETIDCIKRANTVQCMIFSSSEQ